MKINLKEWKDLTTLTEFKDNPFIPIFSLPPEMNSYLGIVAASPKGINIKAKNYVGIFPLSDNITITVSPKVPVEDFLYILYKSKGMNVNINELRDFVNVTRKKLNDSDNIFDFLLYMLLFELEKIKSKGFLKKSDYDSDSTVIKGKILIRDTLNQWSKGNKTRVICEFFQQSKDNPENRAIKFALWILLNFYSKELNEELKLIFFEKYRWFDDIYLDKKAEFMDYVENTIFYQRLPNNRSYYYNLLELSLFFITQSSLDYKSADNLKVNAFIVNMNEIFEKYIFYVLKEKLKYPYGVKGSCIIPLFDDTDVCFIKPDFIIFKNDDICLIIDAKYKKYDTKPTNNDLYQLITYLKRLKVFKGILVYPCWKNGEYEDSFSFKGINISVFKFDLSNIKNSEQKFKEFVLNQMEISL